MTEKNRVCILVGSLEISGGTYVILQHASFLQAQGYSVVLAVLEEFDSSTALWHDLAHSLSQIPIQESYSLKFDLVIATWWKTAHLLGNFKGCKRAYFVQSIESRFYDKNQVPLKQYIDATYDLDLLFCTEANWIQAYLDEKHAKRATLVPNGVRKDLFFANESVSRDHSKLRVLVEGPFNVSFKNTGLAVYIAKKAGADDIWVLTGTKLKSVPYASRVYSQIPTSRVGDIYNQCDIILKLSTVEGMFGPPLEMFHCGGTAVVLNVTGADEYIVHNENGIILDTKNVDEIIYSLRELLSDPDQISLLKEKALKTAEEWPGWDASSEKFMNWVSGVIVSNVAQASPEEPLRQAEEKYLSAELRRLDSNRGIKFRQKIIQHLSRSDGWVRVLLMHLIAYAEVLRLRKSVQ